MRATSGWGATYVRHETIRGHAMHTESKGARRPGHSAQQESVTEEPMVARVRVSVWSSCVFAVIFALAVPTIRLWHDANQPLQVRTYLVPAVARIGMVTLSRRRGRRSAGSSCTCRQLGETGSKMGHERHADGHPTGNHIGREAGRQGWACGRWHPPPVDGGTVVGTRYSANARSPYVARSPAVWRAAQLISDDVGRPCPRASSRAHLTTARLPNRPGVRSVVGMETHPYATTLTDAA